MRHGTRSSYVNHACRCEACTAAACAYEAERRKRAWTKQRTTTSPKQVRREVEAEDEVDDELVADVVAEMPRTRGECPETRPCPWLACRHHLALEVTPRGGLVPPLDGWETRETCALDVAARPVEPTLDEVGQLLGITRERVRQIEERALRRLQLEVQE